MNGTSRADHLDALDEEIDRRLEQLRFFQPLVARIQTLEREVIQLEDMRYRFTTLGETRTGGH